jgi:hypothetical protein
VSTSVIGGEHGAHVTPAQPRVGGLPVSVPLRGVGEESLLLPHAQSSAQHNANRPRLMATPPVRG